LTIQITIDADAGWYAESDMDFEFTFYTDETKTEVKDISGRTLLWQLRSDVLNDVLISKTTPTNIEITNGPAGLCVVHTVAEDTPGFVEGWYNFSIMTTDAPRIVGTAGTIFLNRAATP